MTTTRIADFYEDTNIFITGFSGYLGKLLVEKLLWSCPEVKRIFVLIRNKKGATAESRLKEILSGMVFDRLRERSPEQLDKVTAMEGDVSEEGLGLHEEDLRLLQDQVHIVFHGAASIRFDDTLFDAFNVNAKGSLRVLRLATTMQNLMSFVQISTAFVNCDRAHPPETICPPKMDWRDLNTILNTIDKSTISVLTYKILGGLPNTYVFTKSLSEHMVYDSRNEIPVAICRPSVVISSKKEPIKGYVDNLNGPNAVAMGGDIGIIRVANMPPHLPMDYITSDMVINGIVIAATKPSSPQASIDLPIYNVCYGKHKITVNEVHVKGLKGTKSFNTKLDVDFIDMMFVANSFWFHVNHYIRHLLSAYFIDGVLSLVGKKPLLVKIRRRIYMAVKELKYFVFNEIDFYNERYRSLNESLHPGDKEAFGFDLDIPIDMVVIASSTLHILRKLLFNEIYEDISKSRLYLRLLWLVDKGAVVLTYFTLGFIFYSLRMPELILSTLRKFFWDPVF